MRRLRAGRKSGYAAAGRRAALAGFVLLGLPAVAGCSSASASAASAGAATSAGAAGTNCGRATTAAGAAVTIRVVKGPADCAAALRAEAGYAAAIRKGDLQGNGGGAPVAVDGWTCESYPTPQALRTGDVSACQTASAEVVAVLSAPATSSAAPAATFN
jgi:hypothetical protein